MRLIVNHICGGCHLGFCLAIILRLACRVQLNIPLAMDKSIYTNYPPQLSPEQQEYLVTATKDWAIQNGLAVRPSPAILPKNADPNGVLATNAPVSLFPSPFPKVCFKEAQALQTVYNQLYAAITCNEDWLGKIIEE